MKDAPEIIEVKDTREYELDGDRWVPIPGSGDPHDCARCGRTHVVHATVRYPDGTFAVVGTGCMNLGADVARKAASRAGTVAKLRSQLAKAEAEMRRADEIWAWANALPVPYIREQSALSDPPGPYRLILEDRWISLENISSMGARADRENRRDSLITNWRQARADERAGSLPGHHLDEMWWHRANVADLAKRLAKALHKP